MKCRVCGSTALELFIRFPQVPSFVEHLLTEEELARDRTLELDVHSCAQCGFIGLAQSALPDDYYDSYDKSPINAQKNKDYQDDLATEVVERFKLNGGRVLEGGCGDGYFASRLNVLGATTVAVEPGGPACDMARDRGVEVIRGYLSTATDLEPASFDAFVCRQVLSHVEDLAGFMDAVDKFLKPGGYALFECPDVTLALDERRYYDFFADYVNYFTPQTLVELTARHGMELVETTTRQGGEYFLAVVRKKTPSDLAARFDGFTGALRDIVAGLKAEGVKIASWGAGGRGVSLLVMAGLGADEIEYVIDSQPAKQGLHTPGSRLPVVPPERLTEDPVGAIIITAIMFQDEILADLRDRLGYTGRVILLLPEPHLAGD